MRVSLTLLVIFFFYFYFFQLFVAFIIMKQFMALHIKREIYFHASDFCNHIRDTRGCLSCPGWIEENGLANYWNQCTAFALKWKSSVCNYHYFFSRILVAMNHDHSHRHHHHYTVRMLFSSLIALKWHTNNDDNLLRLIYRSWKKNAKKL